MNLRAPGSAVAGAPTAVARSPSEPGPASSMNFGSKMPSPPMSGAARPALCSSAASGPANGYSPPKKTRSGRSGVAGGGHHRRGPVELRDHGIRHARVVGADDAGDGGVGGEPPRRCHTDVGGRLVVADGEPQGPSLHRMSLVGLADGEVDGV